MSMMNSFHRNEPATIPRRRRRSTADEPSVAIGEISTPCAPSSRSQIERRILSPRDFMWKPAAGQAKRSRSVGRGLLDFQPASLRPLALVFLVFGTAPSPQAFAGPRPYTVSDSISLKRLVTPSTVAEEPVDEYGLGPDGRSALVVLNQGRLDLGLTEYTLARFDRLLAQAALENPQDAALPRYDVLARFRTNGITSASMNGSFSHGIEFLRWASGGEQLLFIGRGQETDETGQIFRLDMRTRELRQLTRHPQDVQSFQLSEEAQVLIYTSPAPPDWRLRNRRGYVVDGHLLSELLTDDPRPRTVELQLHNYVLDLKTGKTLHVEFVDPGPWTSTIIEPAGRWALVLASLEALPTHWREYPEVDERMTTFYGPKGDSSASRGNPLETVNSERYLFPGVVRQIQLVDLATGAARMLMDAPAQQAGLAPDKIAWSADGRSVVLASSYLPLLEAEGSEREWRRRYSAVVEVAVPSGRVTRIGNGFGPLQQPDWIARDATIGTLSGGDILLRQVVVDAQGRERMARTQRHRKRGNRWALMRASDELISQDTEGAAERSPVTLGGSGIRPRREMNAPAEVEVFDSSSNRSHPLTELNPRMRAIEITPMDVVEFRDGFGQLRQGGLTYPRGYRPGVRYPLVLQTYGFTVPYPFDDSVRTGFAARPLAGRGIMVFQVPCGDSTESLEVFRQYGENGSQMMCYEAAIDFLDGKGLIDRKRVGLIGFSRTGMNVQYAVTYSDLPFAAALISDSMQATPWNYVGAYGRGFIAMRQWDDPDESTYVRRKSLIGAPPFGEGIRRWLERSPTFNLDRIRTPLRYEHHGLGLPGPWDTFAILKRVRRPIELVHIPQDGHELVSPLSHYTSQQGSVDWFDFWLTGSEDPDPSKAAQYRRWRELRREQQAQLAQEWAQATD
jgi:dipeptidyl aminopeptidase/acylaminoacyl peptidase